MREIKRHKQFLKDYKDAKVSDKHFVKFTLFLAALIQNKELPKEALDHSLKGEWQGWREFHVSGDLLVIYKIRDDVLELARIGSHSELFG
jgi:mRNA interferase YafQ